MAPQDIAQNLAGMGRNGDSMLMHVQPREVAGLQALAEANGTSLTTNPHTGMPEAFNLGGVLGAVAPIAAGFALGPGGFELMSPLAAGLTVGAATTALSGGDLGKGIMAGLGGYSGAGFGETLSNAGQGVMKSVEQTGANASKDLFQAGSFNPEAINKPFIQNTTAYNSGALPAGGVTPGLETGSFGPNYALRGGGFDPNAIGNTVDLTQSTTMLTPEQLATTSAGPTSNFDYAMKGAKELVTPEGWQRFKDAGGSGTNLAMMGGSALLGGLEESDIYGKPLKPTSDVYDPYATLNLGGPSSQGGSGLRLLAAGGPVAFAGGGSAALQGGGSGAMQGATPIRIGGGAPAQQPGGFGMMNQMMGRGASVAPVELGLFASQAQIDAAQARQAAAQRSALRTGYMGMGGNTGYMGMGGWQNPNENRYSMASMIGGPRRSTSNAADNAHLNLLNQQGLKLAQGGEVSPTVQTGGIRDLYGTPDDQASNINLSQDGFGLGRLQFMSKDEHQGFAEGGSVPATPTGMDPSTSAEIGMPISAATFNTSAGPLQTEIQVQRPELSAEAMPDYPQAPIAEVGGVQTQGFADGGLSSLMDGYGYGEHAYADLGRHVGMAKGGYLNGPGDGMSDSIPATIEGKQPARLADGEFVIPADVVSHLGNGSTKAGSQRLYGMLDKVRRARTGTKKQGKKINADKFLPA